MTAKRKAVKAQPAQGAPLTIAERTRVACSPILRNAATAKDYGKHFGELDLADAVDVMRETAKAIHAGDTKRIETTLIAQAEALDAIFSHMARRAAQNAGEYLGAMETYLKLALRAQSQCRATLETLATIKHPPNVAFVKQANIAHGPQQVNNGESAGIARAEALQNPPSKLLDAPHEKPEWMDAGTAGTSSRSDSSLETVEARDRPANG